jgi:hypothetical protein
VKYSRVLYLVAGPLNVGQTNTVLLKVKDDVLVLQEGLAKVSEELVLLAVDTGVDHAGAVLGLDDVVLSLDRPFLVVAVKGVGDRREVGDLVAVDSVEGLLAVVDRLLELNRHALGDLDESVVRVLAQGDTATVGSVVHDDTRARLIRGTGKLLLLVTELEASECDTPVVVDGGVVDEVELVDIGKGLNLVPPDLVALDEVTADAAKGLDAVVAIADRLQLITVAVDEAGETVLPATLLDLLVEGRLEIQVIILENGREAKDAGKGEGEAIGGHVEGQVGKLDDRLGGNRANANGVGAILDVQRVFEEEVVGLPCLVGVDVGHVLKGVGLARIPRGLTRKVARLGVKLSKALGGDDELADPGPVDKDGDVSGRSANGHVGHEAVLVPRDRHVVAVCFVTVSLVTTRSETRSSVDAAEQQAHGQACLGEHYGLLSI